MTQACTGGLLCGFRMPSYLADIPLLQCANDIMLLLEGSIEEVQNLSTLLNFFADCLGLQIDHTKSTFVRFGLSHKEEIKCSRTLGTPTETPSLHYLGLPLTRSYLQTLNWQLMIEKVKRRLHE